MSVPALRPAIRSFNACRPTSMAGIFLALAAALLGGSLVHPTPAHSVRLLPPIDARPHPSLQTADFALG